MYWSLCAAFNDCSAQIIKGWFLSRPQSLASVDASCSLLFVDSGFIRFGPAPALPLPDSGPGFFTVLLSLSTSVSDGTYELRNAL